MILFSVQELEHLNYTFIFNLGTPTPPLNIPIPTDAPSALLGGHEWLDWPGFPIPTPFWLGWLGSPGELGWLGEANVRQIVTLKEKSPGRNTIRDISRLDP